MKSTVIRAIALAVTLIGIFVGILLIVNDGVVLATYIITISLGFGFFVGIGGAIVKNLEDISEKLDPTYTESKQDGEAEI